MATKNHNPFDRGRPNAPVIEPLAAVKASANTIAHTQIAEARISYGGRGDISRMQATPAAQSLVERFSPF